MSKKQNDDYWLQEPLNWHAELQRLDQHDAELRLWLPEHCKTTLTELADQQGSTLAQYLRQFIVLYLFGRPILLWMKQQQLGLFYVEPISQLRETEALDMPMFLRRAPTRAEAVKQMGKALSPVKLFIAPYLKTELENAAKHADIRLGQFLREVLYGHCFGHRDLPERLRVWNNAQETVATEWENGSDDQVVMSEQNKIDRVSAYVQECR
jgi:hypothetical protein